jgi:DNA ligase-1
MSDPCYSVISTLEDHPSRLNKEAIILAQAEAGNDEFFAGLNLAYNAMITFGLKQIPEKKDENGHGLNWDGFIAIADRLRNRNLTGNDARDAVAELIKQSTQKEWNGWYRRILIKDMRAGFSESTVNKVTEKKYGKYSIPVFSCQLAHDSANHETKVKGKRYIEVKLDGVRVITIVYPDGRVDQFSRNGKELVNFPHVKEQIAAVMAKAPPCEAMVFDGEIMSGSFQDLMKQIHRKSSATANDAILNLFDVVTMAEFEAGKSDVTQEQRSETVYKWHKENAELMPNVTVVGHELVDLDTAEGQKRFKEINATAIAGGYEGIMIKDPDAGYITKRSVSWLKLKPFIEVSLAVTDVEEGTGKNVGRLGALVCSGQDDGKDIVVNCGSGFSDDNRIEYWSCRTDLIGQIVEVRADAITMNQDGTYSLRFPRFKGFRGFVPGEKI